MFKVTLLAAAACVCLSAGVVKVEIGERSDVLEGAPFGPAGPYERIIAKVRFAVDPKLPANRIITDIDLAPRNENGLVEFSADLCVLKPRDPANGNGTLLFEVSNRGGKGMVSMFNRGRGTADPRTSEDFGDKLLLERGFTLVWVGWQFDVPAARPELMRVYAPVATDNGRPITGLVRSEFTADAAATNFGLGDRNTMKAYEPADPNDATMQLTVRDHPDAARRVIPRAKWRLDGERVFVDGGLEAGRIYEVVYTAKNPVVVGLGPAAVRDMISFLKYSGGPAGPFLLGDQARFLKRAIGFGTSQSGRFLRKFLYDGFNQDERGRKVFDGVWAHVAGAGRGSFNHRFAQPSRDGHPFLNTFYPTDIFPFTDLEESDEGVTEGLLDRARKAGVAPKIFYTNGSYEYWGRNASLIHTSVDGKADAALAPDTRIYFLAGTQHGPGAAADRNGVQNLSNPADYRWTMRALLVDLDDWLRSGKEPPASQYPLIAKEQLTAPGSLHVPRIPGVAVAMHSGMAYRADYGPEFRSAGIVSIEPPRVGRPFATLVPTVDADGNETSGIRSIDLLVPLATYAGWNLRDAKIGAADELYSMRGSYVPFAATRAERAASRDPRPSIEERYASREEFLRRVSEAAGGLARDRFLLEKDVAPVTGQAGKHWDRLYRVQ